MGDAPRFPTTPADVGVERVRNGLWLRRIFTIGLAGFLLLGALNVYGVRSGEVSATGGGYELEVRYAKVSRPGLATPWSVEVTRPGGFDGPVTLATTASYFDAFDENGLDPDPTESVSDGERIVWTFDAQGERLSVSFDARIEPGMQLRSVKATTELLEDGRPVASVRYRTFLMP